MLPRPLTIVWLLFGGLLVLFWPRQALASPPLSLQAVDGCPNQSMVLTSLDLLLGEPSVERDEIWSISMVVTAPEDVPPDEPLVLEITLEGPEGLGERRLTGSDCTELLNAGVVVIALAIGAFETRQITEPSEPSPPAPDIDTSSLQPTEPLVETRHEDPLPPDPTGSWHVTGWTSLAISVGMLPGASVGPALGFASMWRAFRADLIVTAFPRDVGELDSDRGGEFTQVDGTIRGCWIPFYRSISFGACLGIELGWVGSWGYGVDEPRQGSSIWFAPDVTAIFSWSFARRVALYLDASLAIPIFRPTYFINEVTDIHRASAVAGRFNVGIEIYFL